MIAFEEIDDRLKELGRNRAWLADKSGRSEGAIRAALAPNAAPKNRSELLQKALSDVIEREEAEQRKVPALPDRLSLEVSDHEFEVYSQAALAAGMTLKQWMIHVLNDAAAREVQTKLAEKTVSFEPKKGGGGVSPFWVDGRGGIAAGAPIDAVNCEPVPVGKEYPPDHYALKVFGHSMEPKIPDGSTVIVREVPANTFPKQGTIVVYSDAAGATLKALGYRAAKAGEVGNIFGKVPFLKSLNPASKDVQTMEGGKIDAVFVEVL